MNNRKVSPHGTVRNNIRKNWGRAVGPPFSILIERKVGVWLYREPTAPRHALPAQATFQLDRKAHV